MIDPVAISRWISVLREHFPGFTAFDPPSADFDQAERDYKLKTRDLLLRRLEGAASDLDRLDAVHAALSDSNLLQWRAYWSISPKGDADRAAAASAISALVDVTSGDPEGHPEAVASFIRHWMETVPNPQRDHARQIAGFVLMHLNPDIGIYFRRTLLDALYREANGNAFPRSDDPAAEYAEERTFAQSVESAFRDQGLAPRDLIDVQSALWVVFNYDGKAQKERSEAEAMENDGKAPRAPEHHPLWAARNR